MAITIFPYLGISTPPVPVSVGLPIRYRVENTATGGGKTQIACLVRVLASVFVVAEFSVTPLFGATTPVATYEVDIKAACADWFKFFGVQYIPPQFAPVSGSFYSNDQFFYTDFTVQFRFLERDNVTGLISQRPDLFTDTISVVYNTPQIDTTYSLARYVIGDSTRVFCHSFSRGNRIAFNDPFMLSFLRLRSDINIKAEYSWNNNGVRTLVGFFDIPDPIALGFAVQQCTIGVGPANLLFQPFSFGAYAPPPLGQGYSIRLFSGLAAVTTYFDFEIDRRCPSNKVRLYWLSLRGGIDAYNFNNKTQESISYSSFEVAQRPLDWQPTTIPNNRLIGQRFRQSAVVDKVIELETEPLETNILQQIDDLMYSSAVWANISGIGIVPVIIDSIDFVTKNPNDYEKQVIKLTISLANPRTVQLP